MDRTLDSIRLSDEESTRDNMSYLYGRNPSILAYGERPIPSSKQNLISLYEDEEHDDTEDTGSDALTLQTIKVYLRVKPLPRKLKLTKEETEAYQITNTTTLITKQSFLDHNSSTLKGPKTAETICRKFTFTKTFGPETTQLELFDQIIQPKMVDFLAGQNPTVMTYGTTNSGKSYTLQGTTTSPGIIPRGLEYVFSNITTRPTPSYKPIRNSDVVSLNAVDRAQELESKNKLLTFASVDKHQYINAYKQMQKLLQEESPIRPSQACDAQYSVWVSFAEIYNENIFDLLSNDCQKRRPLLKLGTDSNGRAFIKGLKTICVNSGSEAYQVLMAGQYNLKVAATALNSRSSRSHCIFTIKLLKYYVENSPEQVEVSTFAFCDLAGSERLKKTLNVGERLKEAQNINTSLLVLGRCLKSIYEGQSIKQRHEHVGPFRESKLTRLFQRALSGKEQIALIVNVNTVPNLYVETQNVLNFSAIAKKIVVEPKQIKRRVSMSRFSQIVAQSVKSGTDWDETQLSHIVEQTNGSEIEASVFIHQDDFDDLMAENKSLKKELGALKASMLNRDLEIRQELADTYTAMMKKLETDWKNRIRDVEEQQEDQLEWTVNRVETFYKEKISELKSRKRRRLSDDDSDEEIHDIGELEIENSRLKAKIQSLKKTVENFRETTEAALTEKNKVTFELGLTNEELKSVKSLLSSAQEDLCRDGENRAYVEKLRTELSDKQAHIKKLKEFLDEAKDEYITITADAAAMERRLKDQAELLAESQERAGDSEELLKQANVCLAQQTKAAEALEEKVIQQSNLLHESNVREQRAQVKLIDSEETIRVLREKVALLEKNSLHPESVTPDSMLTGLEIKEELFSESESEVSLEIAKTELPEGIVIKTDNEILGIPVTSYDGDRNSEIFVQVQEITVDGKSDENDSLTELKAKLLDSKTENESLKKKCAQSRLEIESLRESFEAVKNQLSHVDKQLRDYKIDTAIVHEVEMLEISLSKIASERETSLHEPEDQAAKVRMTETGCQTAAISERDQTIQTSFVDPVSEEKSVPSTILDNEEFVNSRNELESLKIKYGELESECKEKEALMEKLQEELKNLHESSVSWQKSLASAIAEKEVAAKSLTETKELLQTLEGQISKCRDEHESKIANLEEELTVAKVRDETKSECIKIHTNKIAEIESAFALRTKECEDKISELTKSVEQCQVDKKELEEKVNTNLTEIEALEKRIESANKKEQEKDEEIRQLQKAIKNHLASDINEKKMEKEMKRSLKELHETKEALARADDAYHRYKSSTSKEITDLENQISVLVKNGKLLEVRMKEAQEERDAILRLRSENQELKASIVDKDREMESFSKNREDMISKYENLVKSQQDELERSKREITRFQELFHRMPTTPRDKGNKPPEESLKVPVAVVDLSDSETKRHTRRKALAPPSNCPSSDVKRNTRKKRLYQPVDDSCIDLEAWEAAPPTPSPSTSTRSLRTRKK